MRPANSAIRMQVSDQFVRVPGMYVCQANGIICKVYQVSAIRAKVNTSLDIERQAA
ncbi:hypothetical protein J2T02_002767 [Chitinophaga terrae (ex Kim and Jung 2007)]|uniref:hypothetical protein n=1 Tax=Chitinophaga terrae (ex Kim and Jung 2007) TaxID=408074 RepID=UPI00277E6696|nr:hypothetical protein [Chitinophaga terrae (ex Kim and Jung 2007)]MDQ0107646.1 hypothetical protein [Chitinophaga terrae (ex Kim and Jung 2007)]